MCLEPMFNPVICRLEIIPTVYFIIMKILNICTELDTTANFLHLNSCLVGFTNIIIHTSLLLCLCVSRISQLFNVSIFLSLYIYSFKYHFNYIKSKQITTYIYMLNKDHSKNILHYCI